MKLLQGFFKLIRLPNLVFIALAQLLFQVCIYYPLYEGQVPQGDFLRFTFILFGSLFIAAGGYVINDYFDVDIDEVNKPHAMVVGKIISRRWAMAWHFMLSTSGLVLTYFGLVSLSQLYLVLANAFAILLLWFYSTKYKKSFLVGNLLIALLVSWSILIVFFSKVDPFEVLAANSARQLQLFRFAALYAGFAFLSTLARELVKDVEDREGDRKFGCKTLPIMWGIPVAKLFTAVWSLILLALLGLVLFYMLQLQFYGVFFYTFIFVFLPLVGWIHRLRMATTTQDFSKLSRQLKWILLMGIISMAFFYFEL
jgi:4-hydroxybenzoate polyprenyltransferase